MKRLTILMSIFSTMMFAGSTSVVPAIEPIEIPHKTELVLLGGLSATITHKNCGCGTDNKIHAGVTLGMDYFFNDTLGTSARFTTNWLQTGLYGRFGSEYGVYGLVGAAYSFDIDSYGLSAGAGYAFDNFNTEVIVTKMSASTLITPSVTLTY